MNVDAAIAAALRRICKRIDARCQVAAGRPETTANRSVGQLYRDRAAEAEQAQLRG